MRYFHIEKVDCKSYILYNFYESLKGDILIQYIKYEDGTNNLEHLLSFDVLKNAAQRYLSEEFLIPIVEEMISESESKFDQFGYSANFFQVDEFKSR